MMNKSNSKCIPLDQVEVTVIDSKSDELELRSVLHPELCQHTLSGVLYRTIDLQKDNVLESQYIEILDDISTDLQWLLSLKYEKFWCQVINDESVHASLDSYLRHAPRFKQTLWSENLQQKHNHVHRCVFMVFLRMSTLKESPEHFMTKELFAQLVYDNFLFDIPRLMDICSLYGVPDNRPLLKKMLENIFHNQPHYYDDLKQAAKTVLQVLNNIEEKCNGSVAGDNQLPSKISNGLPKSPLLDMSEEELKDVVLYLSDTMRTLHCFVVDVFPEAGKAFYEIGLIEKLSDVYNNLLPSIRNAIRKQQSLLAVPLYQELRGHMRQSRDNVLSLVHEIIQTFLFRPVLEAVSGFKQEKAEELTEQYFEFLTRLLSHQRFFSDFREKFHLKKDVETITRACPNVGEAHSQFLFQALESINYKGADKEKSLSSPKVTKSPASNRTLAWDEVSDPVDASSSNQLPRTQEISHENNKIEDAETASLISGVRDLLPDLGAGFVEACLRYFDFSSEKVIQMILDDNLPPHLADMDRSTDKIQPVQSVANGSGLGKNEEDAIVRDQPSSSSRQGDYLHDRQNIYDGDEFDVFGGESNFDERRIHRGKMEKSKIEHWTTDDNINVDKLRDLYNRYGLGTEDMDNDTYMLRDVTISNYEDEYDDTYDDAPVGANDADSADELLEKEAASSDESEEEPQHQGYRDRRHFVENPEKIRARNEARRKQKMEDESRRGGRSKRSQTSGSDRNYQKNSSAPQYSNEKNVDKKKREYRANRGSHSRKMLATKKASKGMFMGT